jgi:hypothetical protein
MAIDGARHVVDPGFGLPEVEHTRVPAIPEWT